ncbi:presenilin-like protein [Achlya hypogyna]|uniref:Presenilin-like protein n=1 Tax=Achlya hypogyna TaxID=1202772 RepID=A0A1V9ZKQ5_ACHHY|nr:presenilin-like protein [Achlya hypogyna]
MQTKLLLSAAALLAAQVVADSCPTVCIENFDPVCGTNGKTYSNKCYLDVDACKDPTIKLASNGACTGGSEATTQPSATTALPGCPIHGCQEYLEIVCGSDGKNYDNECFLRKAKCNRSEEHDYCACNDAANNCRSRSHHRGSNYRGSDHQGCEFCRRHKQLYEEPLLDRSEAPPSLGGLSLASVITQLNSFLAVLWPVLITMVLTSLVAVSVQDNETKEAMNQYLYYKDIDASTATTGTKTMEALTNALVVIIFIAVITFVVVLLYKVNCMMGLTGYLMLSSSTLLGLVGSALVQKIFCDLFHWHVDVYSMTLVMYNFAIVGTVSIFYQSGVSPDVGRGYLIITSWSTWAILFALAFWDLFAVLTPCGPLRCLVNLIQTEGRPMPGLLYEAEIHDGHIRRSAKPQMGQPVAHAASEYEMAPLQDHRVVVFENQLREFCVDFGCPNAPQVHAVALQFVDRQKEYWRMLYTKYNVTYVRAHRSYPHYADVFDDESVESSRTRDTIKLGLGDFIFYSVLVARAAMSSFATFAACFLCVIVGLAVTMYLLAHFNALPALPISILLGIMCFFMMVEVATPFLDALVFRGIC